MLIQKKQFLSGMLLGLIPVVLYANFRLKLDLFSFKNKNHISVVSTQSNADMKPVYAMKQTPAPDYQLVSFTQYSSKSVSVPMETATPTPTTNPSPTPTEIIKIDVPRSDFDALIEQYAISSGVDSRMMKMIAKCESGFRPEATNGPYAGIYQFISSTWVSNRLAMGEDPNPELRLNAEEAIKTAAFKMGRDGFSAWPVCSRLAFSQLSNQ